VKESLVLVLAAGWLPAALWMLHHADAELSSRID